MLRLHPAVFLDRDGVIIENRADYVRSWDDVEIYPQALEALAQIRDSPYKIILVTNQSAVGRGIIPLSTADAINKKLVQEIEQANGRIDAVFMCPHAPDVGCNCRKPQPGLLLQAAAMLPLDLSGSIMIGDALTDLEAGRAAGVGRLALVRTGRGAAQAQLPGVAHFLLVPVYDTLSAAVRDLIPENHQ
jgi:D-glycero-D-manno-heptose 1,7-bisphosphate phosphatase